MADPAVGLQKSFTISPPTMALSSNEPCQFRVAPDGTQVKWSIQPTVGTIDANGIYTAPDLIVEQKRILVVATQASGTSATAEITLTTDIPARVLWLGWYAIGIGLVIALGVLFLWGGLYEPPIAPRVIVNPLIVTMNPAAAAKFPFKATILGDDKGGVTWSASDGDIDSNGVYSPKTDPAADKIVTITARSVSYPSLSSSASVHLVPKAPNAPFEITPQTPTALPAQQISFRAIGGDAKWSLNRSDLGSITSDGVFTAAVRTTQALVQVNAWGGVPHQQAAITVVITPTFQRTRFGNWPLMLFVITCGALGSMVYYMSSFVGFVGNQTFRSSWFWFYISRPFVGGALAIIFFFIVGSGMISGSTVDQLMKVGMISALVGLFSDKAVKKLSDILDVILATKDDRKDKVTGPLPPSPAGPPKIASVDPAAIPANAAATVEVKGANFKAGMTVKANGQDVKPAQLTDQSFKLDLTAAQVQAPKVTITVATDQGTVTFDLPVK